MRQRRWLTLGVALALVPTLLAPRALAARPQIDLGFGDGGVARTPLPPAYDAARFDEVAATPEGGVVAALGIAQQVGASFGTAIVALVLQSLLAGGTEGAFHSAFWWATGITLVALLPALALPGRGARPQV